jgi:hypothetical protein
MRNGNEGNGKANAREAILENPAVTVFLLCNQRITILFRPNPITHSKGRRYFV